MSLTKMNIPKKINIGFNNRTDTYTGKLAYIIYTDAKGVLRKATSWNVWRDKNIDPQEFDNIPTAGFVLNKGVGDTKYGWNPRKSWIRVFDPRGFEFEISVANLMFILEECSSIKGKGLEGEFVYAWDGADLVLLPASSQEFKASSNFTNLQTKKITKADIKEGIVFINKDTEKVLYLGRHNYSVTETDYKYYDTGMSVSTKKKHIFLNLDTNTYWIQNGFVNLAEKVSDDIYPSFADEYEKYTKSFECLDTFSIEFRESNNELIEPDKNDRYWHWRKYILTKRDDQYIVVEVSYNNNHYYIRDAYSVSITPTYIISKNQIGGRSLFHHGAIRGPEYTFNQIKEIKEYEVGFVDNNGNFKKIF